MKTFAFALLILSAAGLPLRAEDMTDTLKETVITGSRVAIERELLPAPVTVIGREALSRSDENALLPALMEEVPGLFVTSRGVTGYGVSGGAAGGISLRGFGAGSGQVLILIDGHPQFEAIYGHPVADEYIAAAAQRVEVSRGAASLLYGSNAMGGAINILTRRPDRDGNSLQAKLLGGSYGTLRGSLTDTYRSGRLSVTASGSYDRTDGHRPRSSFDSKSGYARIDYALSRSWRLSASLNLMKAGSENPGSTDTPIFDGTAEVIRGRSGLSLENEYGGARGAVNLYCSWGNHIINDGYTEGGAPREFLFHGTDYMGGVNLYEAVSLFRSNTLTAGADLKLYGGNAYRNPETEIYADHIHLHEYALYLFDQHEAGRFLFHAGLRAERHKLYGAEWIPQAGVSFRAAQHTTLKASVSKGFRTPNLRELYMYATANEELKPEEAWSYDFTAAQSAWEGRLRGELSLFYTRGDNIVEAVAVEGRRQNRNAGSFENSGVELSLRCRALNRLSLSTNYSYLHMQKPLAGAPEHKFYFGADGSAGKFALHAGVMAIGGLYLQTGDDPVKERYVLLNARVSYTPLPWLSLLLRGENLLARRYETMLGFPMPRATFLGGLSLRL